MDAGYKHTTVTLARAVHLSRSHLAREFKAHLGMPLGAYARGLRIDRAKSLLGESDRTITEIAEHLGFPSIHSFSTFFKEHFGTAPRTYRPAARQGRPPADT